jgi:hypothetical protein
MSGCSRLESCVPLLAATLDFEDWQNSVLFQKWGTKIHTMIIIS